MSEYYESVEEYLLSILTETQVEILKRCLIEKSPVAFYGEGIGKSTAAKILKNYFDGVYAPEDAGLDCTSIPLMDGCIALCVRNNTEFTKSIHMDVLSYDAIIAWLGQTH